MNQSSPPPLLPTPRTSVTAIISLIAGILGFVAFPILGVIGPTITGFVAIITGHIAKSEIKKSGGMVTGNGMATAGLVLGYLMAAFGLFFICSILWDYFTGNIWW